MFIVYGHTQSFIKIYINQNRIIYIVIKKTRKKQNPLIMWEYLREMIKLRLEKVSLPQERGKMSLKSLGNTVPTFPNWNVLANVIAMLAKSKRISKSHRVYSKSRNTCQEGFTMSDKCEGDKISIFMIPAAGFEKQMFAHEKKRQH